MSARVWVLGDAVVDLLPESQGRLLQCPGGAPANVEVGIARLGGGKVPLLAKLAMILSVALCIRH